MCGHSQLLSQNKTSAGPLQRSAQDLPSLQLLGLVEMRALSCLCTYQELNATRCLGCCRPLCWYGY